MVERPVWTDWFVDPLVIHLVVSEIDLGIGLGSD